MLNVLNLSEGYINVMFFKIKLIDYIIRSIVDFVKQLTIKCSSVQSPINQ